MAKPKKTPRPKAVTPKGFRDYFGTEVTERKHMLDQIAKVYHHYGFEALETSAVETVEALGKFLPDVDRPNEGVFAWQEDDSDWVALRYDMTAPLARVAAQYRQDLPSPYRRFAMGPVWRNEKPGPGRFRQFYQCDADTVGAPSVAADAEICAMLSDTLEAVGIKRGDYIIRVNNRKVLDGVLEAAGLPDTEEFANVRGIVLRTIDKHDKFGDAGVMALLTEGRMDASGDFTEGAGLSELQVKAILGFVNANSAVDNQLAETAVTMEADDPDGAALLHRARDYASPVFRGEHADRTDAGRIWNESILNYLRKIVGDSDVGFKGVQELREMHELLQMQGYSADRIRIDPSVVRGLGYYTGPVYEAELTFEITDEKGRVREFGSVAGGGRYDDLVKRFTGQAVPATGMSIGVDRLLAALRATGRIGSTAQGPVVVTVMDRDRMGDYMTMVTELRQAGIRAEVYLGNPKNFGNQLKYADKRESPVAIIQGGDEAERGVVQIKDLILGTKLAENASLEEWKDRPNQYEVPRDQMVAKVREIIESYS